jgi:hypothetical protein
MKKTVIGLMIAFGSSTVLARSLPTDTCTFSIGPTGYFKTIFVVNGPGTTNGQLTVNSANGQLITTLAMKEVPAGNSTNPEGRKEVVHMELTANSVLPDIQGLVIYEGLPQDNGATPAALLFRPNAVGTIISGTCVYETH